MFFFPNQGFFLWFLKPGAERVISAGPPWQREEALKHKKKDAQKKRKTDHGEKTAPPTSCQQAVSKTVFLSWFEEPICKKKLMGQIGNARSCGWPKSAQVDILKSLHLQLI